MSYHLVAIGEILWDVFPDGAKFGGAPANFACSAAELANEEFKVTLVSAVGNDKLGDGAIDALRARAVSTDFIQRVDYPTGRVDVHLNHAGIASYEFASDSAWDYISWNPKLSQLANQCDAVCFGTLGQRSRESSSTIRQFIESTPTQAIRIFDVNIRKPFINEECVLSSLKLANALKLNEEELPAIASLCGLQGNPQALLPKIAKRYDLHLIALTLGDKGSILLAGDEMDESHVLASDVIDTVGAGDAFTATLVVDMLNQQNLSIMNRHANQVAAYVCSQAGATMKFPRKIRMA